MSDLKQEQVRKFEDLFGMYSGYVIDFSNKTFEEFIKESVNVSIYNGHYDYYTCSKANLLRKFIKIESNYRVKKLLNDLLDYWKQKTDDFLKHRESFYECKNILTDLEERTTIENINSLFKFDDNDDFKIISNSIREYIDKDRPELALDRLHTYMIKYMKRICDNHGLKYSKKETLNALLGKFNKWLKSQCFIESSITYKIVGSSIKILEQFNSIRNDKSLAHDNDLLNYNESLLIFNNICNTVAFLNSLEEYIETRIKESNKNGIIYL